jgi:hypothetical protein
MLTPKLGPEVRTAQEREVRGGESGGGEEDRSQGGCDEDVGEEVGGASSFAGDEE